MKNVLLVCAAVVAGLLVSPVQADIYTGNGGMGFGGVLGTGNLDLTASGSSINGTLTKGAGNLNDFVVVYIDTIAGGAADTASFTDTGDDNRKAISGFDGGNRSIANFASGFGADFAISFNSGFGGLWQLDNNSNFTFVDAVNLSPTGTNTSATYTFDFDFSEVGITPADSLDFVGTYLSSTAFRSNEAIGASDAPSGGTNVANGAITFSGSETFNAVAIPEPTSAALMFSVCLFGANRRRRA